MTEPNKEAHTVVVAGHIGESPCTEYQCYGHQTALICTATKKAWVTFDTRELSWVEVVKKFNATLQELHARVEKLEKGDKGKRKADDMEITQ
jgi:hypothetical protein